jgi:hypothetical protein
MTVKRSLFACALAAITSFSVLPTTASATLLSTLTAGGTITVGDLVFGGFSYLNTGDMPSGSGVNVVTYVDGAGDVGLMFQGAFIDFLGGAGSDALIGFSVTELDATKNISGATLTGNPTVLGGSGVASVTETFLPSDTNLSLSIFSISPGPSKLSDSGTFTVGHSQVIVQKDVLALSATVGGGVPTLSFITQTFHESKNNIPEPASFALMSTALVGLWIVRLRRRRR